MPRITKAQVETAFNVWKIHAKKHGIDAEGYEFIRYPSGYGLEKDGMRLLIRGFRSLSVWYDILDAATETFRLIELQKEKRHGK